MFLEIFIKYVFCSFLLTTSSTGAFFRCILYCLHNFCCSHICFLTNRHILRLILFFIYCLLYFLRLWILQDLLLMCSSRESKNVWKRFYWFGASSYGEKKFTWKDGILSCTATNVLFNEYTVYALSFGIFAIC